MQICQVLLGKAVETLIATDLASKEVSQTERNGIVFKEVGDRQRSYFFIF